MTDLHACTCGKSAIVACIFCDEWLCEACYELKHRGGEHVTMTDSFEDLEAVYGPAAPYSENKRGDHITYTTAEGLRGSGVIVWVQAPFENIGIKYIVAPDDGGFLDFVLLSDVIMQNEQEP